MRLDKYLKVSRIIKRRSIAKEISDQGRVLVNGAVGKSSTKVSVGDEIEIKFGNRTVTYRVEALKDTTKKDEAKALYTMLREDYKS